MCIFSLVLQLTTMSHACRRRFVNLDSHNQVFRQNMMPGSVRKTKTTLERVYWIIDGTAWKCDVIKQCARQ